MDATDIEHRFTYHPPQGDQIVRYEQLRATALAYAQLINALSPDSHEKFLAITHLEQAVMWANAAIARNE